ncbi:MAG: tetratricopeptide repeat protein [Verrucomicrobiota bacterium]
MIIRCSHFTRGIVILFAVAVWQISASESQHSTNTFERGCAAYEARDFAEAARQFNDELKRKPSAEAWRNLGNAEWQGSHFGEAILAWERALWINPFDADAGASLRHARRTAQLAAAPLRWWERFSTWLPVDAWGWTATVSFWLAVTLAFGLPVFLGWRRSAWTQSLAAVGFGLFLLTIPGMVGVHTRTDLGVVLSSDTPLRLTPTRHAQINTRLAAGEMAGGQSIRGDYIFIHTSSGDSGWIEKSQFRFISKP